jgi:photosynthetic reaction center cytochrome c subunit
LNAVATLEQQDSIFLWGSEFMTDRKRLRMLLFVAVLAVSGITISRGRAQSPATPHTDQAFAPRTAEQQFKNIQVLKGIPAEQLIPTMQFITASLGVECGFCHVPDAFEKDDKKPKQTARKMMEMEFAINKESFDGHREVTCNSCHRGAAKPIAVPAVMTSDLPVVVSALAGAEHENSGPTAEQLLDKYLQAIGGAAGVDKVNTRVMKGTIDFGHNSFPIDIYCKDPEKRISFTHMPEGDSVTAFNGQEGWLGIAGSRFRDMHGSDLDGAGIDADLHLATHFKTMFTDLRVHGTEKIGDRDTYEVVGRREGKPPIDLYFDQQSGLLVRLIRYSDTALGLLPTQIDYSDYRDTNGVKIPYRWTLARPTGRFTIQVSDLQQNVPVDDAKFAKPAQPPPQGEGK